MRLLLLASLLSAFGLRVVRLDYQELRGDEAFGYFFSLPHLGEIVERTIALQEPHPVASYFLQHIWLNWAGHSEFALRFFGVWFGVLAVALIYRLGRELELDASCAAVAALLLAVSPYAIWHSQDARMYSMSLALTLASTGLAVLFLQDQSGAARSRPLIGLAYVITSWLALHTHYFAAFVILAQNLFVLTLVVAAVADGRRADPMGTADGRRWTQIVALRIGEQHLANDVLGWLGLQAALALLYLPWLLRAQSILTEYTGNGDSPGFFEMLRRTFGAFAVGESLPDLWQTVGAGVAVVLLALGVWRLLRTCRTSCAARFVVSLLLFYLCTPLAATWISALRRPIFDERYLIAAAPPLFLLVAAAFPVAEAWRQRSPQAILNVAAGGLCAAWIALMALSLGNYYTNPAYSKTVGWRELAQTFTQLSAGLSPERVRLVENFPDPTLWYYYDGPVEHRVLPPAPHDADGAQRTVAALRNEEAVQRVVLVVQPAVNWDERGIAQTALAEQYRLLAETRAGPWPVQVYAHPPEDMASVDVQFQNGLTLVQAAFAPSTVPPGGALTVHLAWQGESPTLTGTETVFVHVVGPDGAPAAQADRPLDWPAAGADGDAPFITSYGILIPEEVRVGTYRLLTGLYDPAQDGAPRVLTEDGEKFIELGELFVVEGE